MGEDELFASIQNAIGGGFAPEQLSSEATTNTAQAIANQQKKQQQVKKQARLQKAIARAETNPIAEAVVRGAVGGWLPDDEPLNVEPIIPAQNEATEIPQMNWDAMRSGLARTYDQFTGQTIASDENWRPMDSADVELVAEMQGRKAADYYKQMKADLAAADAEKAYQERGIVSIPEYLFQQAKKGFYDPLTGIARTALEMDKQLPWDAVGLGEVANNFDDAGLELIKNIRENVNNEANVRALYDTQWGKDVTEFVGESLPSIETSIAGMANPAIVPLSTFGSSANKYLDRGNNIDEAVVGASWDALNEYLWENVFGVRQGYEKYADAMKRGTLKNMGKNMLEAVGQTAMGEWPSEMVTQLMQGLSDSTLDPENNPTDTNAELWDTTKAVVGQTLGMAAPGLALNTAGHAIERSRYNERKEFIDQLKQQADQSEQSTKALQSGIQAIKDIKANEQQQQNLVNQIKPNLINNNISESHANNNDGNPPSGASPAIKQESQEDDGSFSFIGDIGASNMDKADGNRRMEDKVIAQEMERVGRDPREIKLYTNWERGADGDWRYEAHDEPFVDGAVEPNFSPEDFDAEIKQYASKLKSGESNAKEYLSKAYDVLWNGLKEKTTTVGELLGDKAEILQAYPEMKSIPISFVRNEDTRDIGGYDPKENSITMNTLGSYDRVYRRDSKDRSAENFSYEKYMKGVRSAILHEIQHAIQFKEGFAVGGDPFVDGWKYGRLAGENESNSTGARADFTREQRANSLSEDTETYERPQQIVRRSEMLPNGDGRRADGMVENRSYVDGSTPRKSEAGRVARRIAENEATRNIEVVQSFEDLPQDVQDSINSKAGKDTNKDFVEGYNYKGKSYIIADNVTPERAVEVARHETIGHIGIKGMLESVQKGLFKKVIDATSRAIKNRSNEAINKIADELRQKYQDRGIEINEAKLAEEVLCTLVEKNHPATFVQKVIGAIKMFLRRNGFINGDISHSEVLKILKDAETWMQENSENEEAHWGAGEDGSFQIQGAANTNDRIDDVKEKVYDFVFKHWGKKDAEKLRSMKKLDPKFVEEVSRNMEKRGEFEAPEGYYEELEKIKSELSDVFNKEEKGEESWQNADENDRQRNEDEENGGGENTPPEDPNDNDNEEVEHATLEEAKAERENPDPLLTPPPSTNAFEVPREKGLAKMWTDFIRQWVNRMIDIEKIQDAIVKAAGIKSMPDSRNVMFADAEYQRRVQRRHEILRDRFQNPIMRLAKQTGLSNQEIADWLIARHIHLDKVNHKVGIKDSKGHLMNNPSGMTDLQARQAYDKHKDNKHLQELGKLYDAMNNYVLEQELANGMITKKTYDRVTGAYKHYAPLRDIDDAWEHKTGTGFSLLGGELGRRKGRDHKATADALAQSFINSENAMRRIEKAKVGRTLLRLVQGARHDAFWSVKTPNSDIVPANVLVVKDTNARDVWIEFNAADPIAMNILDALKNLDTPALPGILKSFQSLNNYMGKWMTAKNPGFILRNLIRDIPTAMFHMTDTLIKGKQLEVLKTLPSAWKVLSDFARTGKFADKHGEVTELHQLLEEFIENGGRTNFLDVSGNVLSRAEELQKMLDRMEKDGSDKRNLLTAMGKYIEDTNMVAENVVRFASFVVARKNGVSIPKAINIAQNISVNFGKRGASSHWLSAFYLFGNASVQGTARLMSALSKSKMAKGVAGAMIGVGVLNRVALQLMFGGLNGGLDDDDPRISQFEKDNYLIIPVPGKEPVVDDFIKIPMPHGLRAFHMIGGYLADLCLNHKVQQDPMKYGLNMLLGLGADFSPLPSGSALQAAVPTFLQPAMGLLVDNKTGLGGDIVQPHGKDDPAHNNAKYGTELHWKWLSKAMNYVTGGDQTNYANEANGVSTDEFKGGGDDVGKRGLIQLEPDWIKHAFESYFKPGLSSDIDKTLGVIEKMVTRFVNHVSGKELKPMEQKALEVRSKDLPIAGSFVGAPWHPWESTGDKNYNDTEFNLERAKIENDRKKKRDGSGWGEDGEYHFAKIKSADELKKPNRKYEEDKSGIPDKARLTTGDNREIENTISAMIGSAKDEIRIATYELSSRRVVEQLLYARERNVPVYIVVDEKQNRDRASEQALAALADAGCYISASSAYNAMHPKLIVVDGKHTHDGSFNLSSNAVARNAEHSTFFFNDAEAGSTITHDMRKYFTRSHEWKPKGEYDPDYGRSIKPLTKKEIDEKWLRGEDTTVDDAARELRLHRAKMDRQGYKLDDKGMPTSERLPKLSRKERMAQYDDFIKKGGYTIVR